MEEGKLKKVLQGLVNPRYGLQAAALAMAIYHLYKAYFGIYEVWRHRGVHLIFVLLLAFLSKGLCDEKRSKAMKVLDLLYIGLTLAVGIYIVTQFRAVELRAGVPNLLDTLSCVVLAFLILAASWRVLGLPMTSVTIVFVLYVLFGSGLPGILSWSGASPRRLVDYFFNSTYGIMGLPLSASAVYIAIFIYFATFLLRSGAADYFKEIAYSLAGHRVGGPAKVAVLGSALVGTMMGAGVANIATTGSFTIPMMIRMGYRKHVAAAIEATASMGGQIMPPIMGSVIFLIAEFTGIPFYKLMVYSAVPAVMYFLCIFCEVHFEARKMKIQPLPKSELTPFKEVLFKGPWYLLLPLPLLVVMLFVGYTAFLAGFYGIIAVVICAAINPKTRMGPRKIINTLIEGSINCVVIAVACGAASVIVGAIGITGLGLRFSALLIALAGGKLLPLLFFAMIASLILGMGVGTTVATYIIVATLTIPALIHLGVVPVAAHLFCFYFAILCGITPPVAIGAFVAAGIAKAENMRTAFHAMKFGIVGLVVPFLFVYDTSFILIGTPEDMVKSIFLGFVGVFALAASIQGYMRDRLSLLTRGLVFVLAAMILWPVHPLHGVINLIGITVFVGYYVLTRMRESKVAMEAAD